MFNTNENKTSLYAINVWLVIFLLHKVFLVTYAPLIWETVGIDRMLSPTFHCLNSNPSVSVKGP